VDSKRIARYFAGYWLASNRDLREFCDCERIRADCSEQLSPALCLHQKAHSVRATHSRDSRRHRESSSSVSTPRCRRRGWPVEMAAPQPGDDIDTLLFGA